MEIKRRLHCVYTILTPATLLPLPFLLLPPLSPPPPPLLLLYLSFVHSPPSPFTPFTWSAYHFSTARRLLIGRVIRVGQIAGELRRRALEVVFAEWTGSGFQEVNEDSYLIWEQSDWWMKPWLNELAKKSPLLL